MFEVKAGSGRVARPRPGAEQLAADDGFVLERAGREARSHAGVGADRFVEVEVVVGCRGDGARAVGDGREGERKGAVGAPAADLGVGRDARGEVVLEAQHAVGFGDELEQPRRVVVVLRIGGGRQLKAGAEERAALRARDVAVGVADVGVDAGVLAAEVEARRQVEQRVGLVGDRRVATHERRIEAQARAVVRPEAAAEIDVAAELAVAGIARRELGDGRHGRALGREVDGAADRPVGRHAAQHRRGPAEHFYAVDAGQVDVEDRRHAVQAVERHVAGAEQEAADLHAVVVGALGVERPDRRIVVDRIDQGARLVPLDVLLGIGRRAERRVHVVAIAELADAAAARDVAAGIDGQGIADLGLRRRRVGLHAHRVELHGAAGVGPAGDRHGVGRREAIGHTGARQQPLQGLLGGHGAADGAAGLARHGSGVDGDLQAGLLAEGGQRLGERLGRDVERRGATGLGFQRRGLDGRRLRRCLGGDEHADRRQGDRCQLEFR